ncbi:MFS transporter [Bacillus sp. USDA818B3_A]|uniref:MFS transporter n=1 Tax=Bacillus sp. USDA818B3_A TaxID=2698834 RepID=UPI00136AF05B|nr:MFS transporter [Bacillus sp. USDA818B3_A]
MFSKGRTTVLIFLFLAGVVNYLDRSALSIAAPFITEDLHLSPTQLGIVFSSFSVGYAVFNFIGGMASDRYGAKLTLFVAMVVWSLFSGAVALAFSLVSLIVIRVLFGMGEGPLSATINKMINNWFPSDKRATAIGLANSGTPLGGAIAGPIVGIIALNYGWKISFIIIMVIGILWAAGWWMFVKDKPAGERKQNNGSAKSNQNQSGEKIPLSYYLKQRTVLFTAFAFFAYNYILFFFLTWFPSYLTNARGLSIKEMSVVTVIPWVLGFIGLASGGLVSDFVYRKVGKALFARKVVLVSCLFTSAICIGVAGLVTTTVAAVTLVALSVFFLYLTGAIYWAIVNDVVDQKNVGSVGGFMHFLANTAGIIGPTLTGYLVQVSGTYTAAFLLAGGLAVFASLSVIKFVKPITKKYNADLTEKVI